MVIVVLLLHSNRFSKRSIRNDEIKQKINNEEKEEIEQQFEYDDNNNEIKRINDLLNYRILVEISDTNLVVGARICLTYIRPWI